MATTNFKSTSTSDFTGQSLHLQAQQKQKTNPFPGIKTISVPNGLHKIHSSCEKKNHKAHKKKTRKTALPGNKATNKTRRGHDIKANNNNNPL